MAQRTSDRGPEALDLLLALNAGCSGLATIHANSAIDALDKVVGYCLLAGQNVLIDYVRSSLASVVDLVVFLRRTPSARVVEEIVSIRGAGPEGWHTSPAPPPGVEP